MRYFREKKGLTQKRLGELVDFKPQTVASYESYPRPLPDEFAEKAAKVLGISVEMLQSAEPQEMSLREGVVGYRDTSIPADTLTDELLKGVMHALAERLPNARPEERGRIMHGLNAASAELDRRERAGKQAASSSSISEEAAVLKSEGERYDRKREK